MTDIVMEAEINAPQQGTEKCSQPGCIRPAPHEGMRHRYAPTKDLQPEPEQEHVSVPETDERPFAGELSSQPRNHAFTVIDRSKGLYVAWDTCAGCQHHITRCFCPNGPKTPEYIERWRQQQFPLAQPTMGEAKQIARDVAVDLGVRKESERFEPGPLDAANHERVATHMCNACGEPLYLLDTPVGKSALTVSEDSSYCTVDDNAIHVPRGITDDDRKHNPQWFGGAEDDDDQPDVDDEAPVVQATDDPDYDEAAQQEAEAALAVSDAEMAALMEPTPVETENTSSNIDPEVGF